MEYRNFGRTGVKVTPICVGCMNFGWKTEENESIRIVHEALEAGINFFDTANVYGRGKSEIITGKAIKLSGKRDSLILATKVHGKMDDNDPNMLGNSRRHIIQQCELSLKRLQVDWIDVYQIHRPQPEIPIDETLRALDDLVRAGKVRYIGSSTFAAWQVTQALHISKELGLNRFVSEQPPYHPLDRRIERELIPMARTYGIALIPWSPLASGYLSGKYTRRNTAPEGARMAGQDTDRTRIMFSEVGFKVLDAMQQIADAKGCTISQLAIAWNMHQPGITSPIIGPRTVEHLKDNLGALNVQITDEDCRKIDEVAPPGGAIVPDYYEANFGPDVHRIL